LRTRVTPVHLLSLGLIEPVGQRVSVRKRVLSGQIAKRRSWSQPFRAHI
jgi:hypothetical protein